MNHSDSTPSNVPGELPEDASAQEIETDIEQTRERLAETVEALAAKADVKAQATQAAEHAKAEAQHKIDEGAQKVKEGADEAVSTYRGWPVAAQAGVVAAPLLLIVWLIVRAIRNR